MTKDLPRTRAEAIAAGSVRYFTGEPCPRGHTEPRHTLSGYCVCCQRLATQGQRAAIKAKRAAT